MNISKIRVSLKKRKITKPWESYPRLFKEMPDQEIENLFFFRKDFVTQKKINFIKYIAKNIDSKKSILEVGGGNGVLSRFLSKTTKKDIVCLDIDKYALDSAKVITDYENIKNVSFINGNFTALKEKDKFSIIILDSVLEHIEEYESWLKKINSLLDEGGECIIIVPSILGGFSLLHDFDWKHLRWKEQPYNYHSHKHVNHFLFRRLVKEFEENGFTLKKVFKCSSFATFLNPVLSKLKFISLLNFSYNYLSFSDYYISKVLPSDISTRVVVFKKK